MLMDDLSESYFLSIFGILAIFLCLSANSCRPAEPPAPQPAVYRWKTSPELLPPERIWMETLGIRRIYLRFFDIDRSSDPANPIPVAPLKLPLKNLPDSLSVVPVVFITNRALLDLPKGGKGNAPSLPKDDGIPKLAQHIYRKITDMSSRLSPAVAGISEWQLDCDWTAETRDAYFALLGELRRLLPDSIALSATIRLHQIKYPGQTGIPPVDRGMLMYYNMDDVRAADTRNSILDRSVASAYLGRLGEYPLPLDVALPIFGWIVVRREGRVINLLSGLDERALQDSSRFEQLASGKWFRVKRSTYLNAYYLYAGDSLRVEGVQADSLYEAWRDLQSRLPREQRYVALYHLDTASVNRLHHEEIRRILGW